jgi:hypothetical protein
LYAAVSIFAERRLSVAPAVVPLVANLAFKIAADRLSNGTFRVCGALDAVEVNTGDISAAVSACCAFNTSSGFHAADRITVDTVCVSSAFDA